MITSCQFASFSRPCTRTPTTSARWRPSWPRSTPGPTSRWDDFLYLFIPRFQARPNLAHNYFTHKTIKIYVFPFTIGLDISSTPIFRAAFRLNCWFFTPASLFQICKDFSFGDTNATPEFLAKFPLGKVKPSIWMYFSYSFYLRR